MTDVDRPLSVALAHHWLIRMRGGEKVLRELARCFPSTPIYTLIADRRSDDLAPVLKGEQIRTSWLQTFSFVPGVQRLAFPLLPAAARSLDATAHDVVICSDAAVVKGIRTRPDALKICYCHSPMRYVWDLYDVYREQSGFLGRTALRLFASRVREADQRFAQSVTAFVANSRHVADRIQRCYGRPSVVIYPPVEMMTEAPTQSPEDFYLIVGENVPYKRNDLAIEACRRLGRRLLVIGRGYGNYTPRRAEDVCVEFLGWQIDEAIADHMRRCRALLFCGEEDFGIVPVEVQAAGRPVIAYGKGGACETVVHGKSGLLFEEQTVACVTSAIEQFETTELRWTPKRIQAHAKHFSAERFRDRFMRFYAWCLDHYREGGAERVRGEMEAPTWDHWLD